MIKFIGATRCHKDIVLDMIEIFELIRESRSQSVKLSQLANTAGQMKNQCRITTLPLLIIDLFPGQELSQITQPDWLLI